MKKTERPAYCEEAMLDYLDELRESGVTNMLGAGAYLREVFPELSLDQSYKVLGYWMDTFPRTEKVKAS